MKYKYEITDERVEKVISVCDPDWVQKEFDNQYKGDSDSISICYKLADDTDLHIRFPKSIIKRVYVYDCAGWNPFPQVLPQKEGRYLVQCASDYIAPCLYLGDWEPCLYDVKREEAKTLALNLDYWKSKNVIAFHELPPMFNPKKELEND